MFECSKCGRCCQNIKLSSIYQKFNRGDGICRYFDDESSLCTIYQNRPIECNVDAMYDIFFAKRMDREKYYELNHWYCEKLKKGMPL